MIDTRVTIIDWRLGLIGGFIAPFGDPEHKTYAGKVSGIDNYQGHYLTPDTELAFSPRGVPLYADHARELGPIGELVKLRGGDIGAEVQGRLYANAARVCWDSDDRTLPKLLQAGLLYYSPRLDWPNPITDLAPDGRVIRAILTEVSVTWHPATPKESAA